MRALLALLIAEEPLLAHYHNQRLKGEWAGYWDAHIGPDWLLIYRVKGGEL